MVVNRLRDEGQPPREAYRDVSLSGGHRWLSPRDAISFAMARAKEVIRTEPFRLAC